MSHHVSTSIYSKNLSSGEFGAFRFGKGMLHIVSYTTRMCGHLDLWLEYKIFIIMYYC